MRLQYLNYNTCGTASLFNDINIWIKWCSHTGASLDWMIWIFQGALKDGAESHVSVWKCCRFFYIYWLVIEDQNQCFVEQFVMFFCASRQHWSQSDTVLIILNLKCWLITFSTCSLFIWYLRVTASRSMTGNKCFCSKVLLLAPIFKNSKRILDPTWK